MTAISAAKVKELRDKTGAGIMDCKAALTESDGNVESAIDFLRKKGIATAKKRAGRAASEGTIQSYIHMGGKIGVMVEVNCETDFVAKNDDFREFAKNIAMHIAATNPVGITPEDVPEDIIEKVKEMYPDGFEDNLITFENSRGEIELALPFETEDTYYLIKMPKNNTSEEEEEEDYDNSAIDEFDNFENLEITDDVADEEE